MTAKDGKPCEKCGRTGWYKGGNCMTCARERTRKWKMENPDRVAINRRNSQIANVEKERERSRKRRRENPERAREHNRKWERNNPVAVGARTHRHRAAKTAAGGSYTPAEWRSLVEHYGNKCLCCGRTDVALTVDHVVPVSKGGSSNIDNLQPLCLACNSSKNDKIIDYRPGIEFGRWIQKLFTYEVTK